MISLFLGTETGGIYGVSLFNTVRLAISGEIHY